jgi:hypothetical protein
METMDGLDRAETTKRNSTIEAVATYLNMRAWIYGGCFLVGFFGLEAFRHAPLRSLLGVAVAFLIVTVYHVLDKRRVPRGYRLVKPDEDTLERWKERERNGGAAR